MISSRLERIAEEIYSASRRKKYSEKSLSLEERDILNSEGIKVISLGSGRIVCVHPRDASKVVKFARSVPTDGGNNRDITDGAIQNKSEVYLWNTASEKIKSFLGEIHGSSADNLIVIMERYEEPRSDVQDGVTRLMNELGTVSGLPIHEIREENVAMNGSHYVLIDYGGYEK